MLFTSLDQVFQSWETGCYRPGLYFAGTFVIRCPGHGLCPYVAEENRCACRCRCTCTGRYWLTTTAVVLIEMAVQLTTMAVVLTTMAVVLTWGTIQRGYKR